MEGYILGIGKLTSKFVRAGLFIAGILLGFPETVSDIIGLITSAVLIISIIAYKNFSKGTSVATGN